MYLVEFIWNTEADGTWVGLEPSYEDAPKCLYGPFPTQAEADWHLETGAEDDKCVRDAWTREMTPEDNPEWINDPAETLWANMLPYNWDKPEPELLFGLFVRYWEGVQPA